MAAQQLEILELGPKKNSRQELDRRFWSLFPFTRARHFGVAPILTHTHFLCVAF